jgi:predicted ArsR family transcriptional regulator
MAKPLSTAKQRVLEHLKMHDGATASEVAAALDITEAAVRQHIDALVDRGLVARRPQPRSQAGRGRSPVEWVLTPEAGSQFADRHGQLTVELLGAIHDALGPEGLDRVIDSRAEQQLEAYRAVVPAAGKATLEKRVRALARQRTAEGYMADVHRDGDGFVLVEHHCPICTAATACPGFCRSELELFRETLGSGVPIERTAHLLAGDVRCAYLIRPVGTTRRAGARTAKAAAAVS